MRLEGRSCVEAIRNSLGQSTVRYTLVLMLASAAAYVLLFAFMNDWGSVLLHVTAPSTGKGLSGLFYNSSTQGPASLHAILTSWQTVATGEYWFALLALVGFLPLFAPRSWVLIVPWMGWTFLTDSSHFSTLGRQYSFVAAGPIFIGVAFGLQHLYQRYRNRSVDSVTVPLMAPQGRGWKLEGHRRTLVAGACVGVIVAANLILLPFDPVLPYLGVNPGTPFETGYFDHSLEVQPGWSGVDQMLSLVPSNATVGAPPELYALIATHRGAVILRGGHDEGDTQALPFNLSIGPDYAFLYPFASRPLDAKEWGNLSNPTYYGLRAYVASSTVGPVYLYARSFTGVAQPVGPVLPGFNATWTPQNGLTAGAIASTSSNASSPSGYVIESNLAEHSTGQIWNGTAPVLGAGSYTVTATVALAGTNGTIRPAATVLQLVGEGFDTIAFDRNVTFGELSSTGWLSLQWNLTLTSPLPTYTVLGVLKNPDCSVAVASVEIVFGN
jgi:Predicted membrane protein (DUF2079)